MLHEQPLMTLKKCQVPGSEEPAVWATTMHTEQPPRNVALSPASSLSYG